MTEEIETKAYDDSEWSGAASQWDSPEAYCSDCLIDMNASGEKKTKDKCKLPYRKPGSNKINKAAMRNIASRLAGTDAPPEEKKKVAKWLISHHQSAFGTPASASTYRMAGMKPPMHSAKFYKDAAGIWYFGVYSNNYEDREGEIITWDAHKEYATWMKEKGIVPQITFMHQPKIPDVLWLAAYKAFELGKMTSDQLNAFIKTVYQDYALAETKAVIPLDGFTLVVGKVYDDKISIVEKLMNSDVNLAMSHGFITLEYDDNIIEKYRSFEFAVLPDHRAANVLTLGEFIVDEKRLTDEDRQLLNDMFGEDTGEKAESAIERAKEILRGILSSKEVSEEETPEEDVAEETEEEPVENKDYEDIRQKIVIDLNVDGLQQTLKTVSEAIQVIGAKLDEMAPRMDALDTKMKELEKSDDEKIAAQFQRPVFHAPDWNFMQPTQRKEVEEQEDLVEKLKELAPQEKVMDAKNPLVLGFWNQLPQAK